MEEIISSTEQSILPNMPEVPAEAKGYPANPLFDGVDIIDRARISAVGFDSWLDEVVVRHDKACTYRRLTDEEVLAIKPTDTGMIAKLVRSVRRTVPQSEKFYERAAIKLTWFLRAGYPLVEPNLKELSTPTLISFYSDCTGTEMEMSDSAFRSDWSEESAHTRRRIRIEKGYLADESGKIIVKAKKNTKRIFKLICAKCSETFPAIRHGVKKCAKCGGPPDPSKRYCALGPKCFRAEKGHPAECLTRSPYCSDNCLGAFQAAVKRSREAGSQKAGSAQSDSPSQICENAGF